jgi:type I restriction enzyme, R subunit
MYCPRNCTSRAWVSYDENGNVVFPEADEVKSEELGTRFEEWLMDQEINPDQERWLHWVESQIRENASIFDDFTVDHLEFPPFSLQGGRRKAAELFGGDNRLTAIVQDINDAVFSTGGNKRGD